MEHLLKIINYSLFGLEVTQEQSALPSVGSVHTHKRGGNVYQQHHQAVGIHFEFSEQSTHTHALFLYSFIKQFNSRKMCLSWALWGSKGHQDMILTCAV